MAGGQNVDVDRALHSFRRFFEIKMKARITAVNRGFQSGEKRGIRGPWSHGYKLQSHDPWRRERRSRVSLPVLEHYPRGVHVNGAKGNLVG